MEELWHMLLLIIFAKSTKQPECASLFHVRICCACSSPRLPEHVWLQDIKLNRRWLISDPLWWCLSR